MDFVDELRAFFREGLRSNNLRSCSRWAEHRRVMGAPFNGPYGFSRHPWCREIHDSQAAWTIAMKAAQLGVTETGINRAFFTLDQSKRDVLYVLPTTLERERLFQGPLRHRPEAQPLPEEPVRRYEHRGAEIDRQERPLHSRQSRRQQPEVHPGVRVGLGRVGRNGHPCGVAGLGAVVGPDREAHPGDLDADRAEVRHPQAVPDQHPGALLLSVSALRPMDGVGLAGLRGDHRRVGQRPALQGIVPQVQGVQAQAGARGQAGVPGRRQVAGDGAERLGGGVAGLLHQPALLVHGDAGRIGDRLPSRAGRRGGEHGVPLQQAGRAVHRRGCPGHGRDDRSLHQRALDQRRPAADRRRPPDNDGRGPGQDRLHLGRGVVVRQAPRHRHQCGGHRQAAVVRQVLRRGMGLSRTS